MGTTTLADSLFGKVQRQVLSVLYGHPERSYYGNELLRLVDCGHGAVQRELARLTAAGLVTVQRIGNQKHYQANDKAPIFSELRGIILKTCGLTDVLRDALAPIAGQIDIAFVYGSIAKHEDHAASDVDLLLVTSQLTYPDVFAVLQPAEAQLARTINPALYAPAALRDKLASGNAFVGRIFAQPKMMIIGSENDLEQFSESGQGR